MDAEDFLDNIRQHICQSLDLCNQTCPAGFQAVPQTVHDVTADVQPAKCREDVEDCLADLRQICNHGRNSLNQAFAEDDYQFNACGQQFRRVVVDDSSNIRDDAGKICDDLWQAVHQPCGEVDDEVETCVNDLASVFSQTAGKVCNDRQSVAQ